MHRDRQPPFSRQVRRTYLSSLELVLDPFSGITNEFLRVSRRSCRAEGECNERQGIVRQQDASSYWEGKKEEQEYKI